MKVKRYYQCSHPLYNACTLYLDDKNNGIAVVRKHFSYATKAMKFIPIDWALADEIANSEYLEEYFKEHATQPTPSGLYPTINLRKLMWALKMKPLPKDDWEKI